MFTPNNNEKKFIELMNKAKEHCVGNLEINNIDGEWWAMDYRADREEALYIGTPPYNEPLLTEERAAELDIDVILCCSANNIDIVE